MHRAPTTLLGASPVMDRRVGANHDLGHYEDTGLPRTPSWRLDARPGHTTNPFRCEGRLVPANCRVVGKALKMGGP